jgi:hypothetical protein
MPSLSGRGSSPWRRRVLEPRRAPPDLDTTTAAQRHLPGDRLPLPALPGQQRIPKAGPGPDRGPAPEVLAQRDVARLQKLLADLEMAIPRARSKPLREKLEARRSLIEERLRLTQRRDDRPL